ncbi:MAG: hypothetical protein GY756_20530, partial [bacterium]|nr:hypothetical protein [bacterium]
IRILSDKINNIKEIIIESHSTGEDILKLTHSLLREPAVLVDLDGKIILEVKKNDDANKIMALIIELIQKGKKGEPIRMLYKSVSPVGGQYTGGAFTDILFNNAHILGKHALTHSFYDHGFHNGFISPDINFLRSEVRHMK